MKNIDSLKGTAVWADLQFYFHELFAEHEDLQSVTISAEGLINDFEARFNGAYSSESILKLLENGFKNKADNYVFKRDDFCSYPARLQEEEVAP